MLRKFLQQLNKQAKDLVKSASLMRVTIEAERNDGPPSARKARGLAWACIKLASPTLQTIQEQIEVLSAIKGRKSRSVGIENEGFKLSKQMLLEALLEFMAIRLDEAESLLTKANEYLARATSLSE